MGRMSELSILLNDLADCGRKLTETAQAIRDFYSETAGKSSEPEPAQEHPDPPEPKKESEPEKTYTKEDVRAILAAKANEAEGKFKTQVRAIVKKYGSGGSLTNINPEDYPAVVKETEELTDA